MDLDSILKGDKVTRESICPVCQNEFWPSTVAQMFGAILRLCKKHDDMLSTAYELMAED